MIDDNSPRVEFNGKLVFKFTIGRNGLLSVQGTHQNSQSTIPEIAHFSIEAQSWHDRYGHLPFSAFKNISEAPQYLQSFNQHCEACQKGKSVKASSPQQEPSIRSTQPLQLLHSDICEPMRTTGIDKSLYMITLVDDYSRMTLVRGLAQKSNAGKELLAMIAIMERKGEAKVEII
jgi:hypothetical protein